MPKKAATKKRTAAKTAARNAPRKRPAAPRARASSPQTGAAPVRIPASGFKASDLMVRDVFTVHPGTPITEVSAMFKLHNIKGAPVVERGGKLVGIITEDDLVFGQLGISDEEREMMAGSGPSARRRVEVTRRVAELMTHNPIAADEEAPVEDLCHLMARLKIHRIPIVRDGKVVGIVSTIDICRMLAEGRARLVPS